MQQIVCFHTFFYYYKHISKRKRQEPSLTTSRSCLYQPCPADKFLNPSIQSTLSHVLFMITIAVDENKPLSQDFYTEVICDLQFHQLKCSCGLKGCLSIHAYYTRFIKSFGEKLPIRICRVICSHCQATHALLLSSMVPYSQLPLSDYVDAIAAFSAGDKATVLSSTGTLDSYSLNYLIKMYILHWEQKVLSAAISFNPLRALVLSSFSNYSMQFMQIKNTSNIFFSDTT